MAEHIVANNASEKYADWMDDHEANLKKGQIVSFTCREDNKTVSLREAAKTLGHKTCTGYLVKDEGCGTGPVIIFDEGKDSCLKMVFVYPDEDWVVCD